MERPRTTYRDCCHHGTPPADIPPLGSQPAFKVALRDVGGITYNFMGIRLGKSVRYRCCMSIIDSRLIDDLEKRLGRQLSPSECRLILLAEEIMQAETTPSDSDQESQ